MTAATAKPEAGTVAPAIRALLRRLLPFAAVFLVTQLLVRLTLAYRAGTDYADDAFGYVAPFLVGAWFDLVVFSVFAVPAVLWWLAMPRSRKGGRLDRYATFPASRSSSSCACSRRWPSTCSGPNSRRVSTSSPSTTCLYQRGGRQHRAVLPARQALRLPLSPPPPAIAYLTRRWLFPPLDRRACRAG